MNTAELTRRLDNIVRFGVIEQTDFTTDSVQPRVRVRTGDILTTWIPITTLRANTDGEHDPIQIGEHVILLSPSGETAQAIVVGKLHSTDFPSPDTSPTNHRRRYRDGYQIDYESEEHKLTHTFPDGAVFSYDAENHIRTAHYPDGTQTTYDAKAHLFSALFNDQTNFSYDAAAHLLTLQFLDGATISYNASSSHLSALLPEEGSLDVVAPSGISITGDITLRGNLTQIGSQTITGDISHTGELNLIGELSQTGNQTVLGVIAAEEFVVL